MYLSYIWKWQLYKIVHRDKGVLQKSPNQEISKSSRNQVG